MLDFLTGKTTIAAVSRPAVLADRVLAIKSFGECPSDAFENIKLVSSEKVGMT